MKLTDAEKRFEQEHGVSIFPGPDYERFPTTMRNGWSIIVVRKSDFLFTAHGDTREAALENARYQMRRLKKT